MSKAAVLKRGRREQSRHEGECALTHIHSQLVERHFPVGKTVADAWALRQETHIEQSEHALEPQLIDKVIWLASNVHAIKRGLVLAGLGRRHGVAPGPHGLSLPWDPPKRS